MCVFFLQNHQTKKSKIHFMGKLYCPPIFGTKLVHVVPSHKAPKLPVWKIVWEFMEPICHVIFLSWSRKLPNCLHTTSSWWKPLKKFAVLLFLSRKREKNFPPQIEKVTKHATEKFPIFYLDVHNSKTRAKKFYRGKLSHLVHKWEY